MRELARAIAFANADLSTPDALREITLEEMAVASWRRTSRYVPFRAEIARALRLHASRIPALLTDREWHAAFRPVCGLLWGALNPQAQPNIQALLEAILVGKATSITAITYHLRTEVQVLIGGSPPGRTTKRAHAPLALHVFHQPIDGYDSLRYGVLLGAHLYHRLAHCQACGRFILGKTDRPVRYCADATCQTRSARPRGKAPSAAAAYKRAQRARLQQWDGQALAIRRTLTRVDDRHKPATLAAWRGLAREVKRGRVALDQCFRWGESGARTEAEQLLAKAEKRLRSKIATPAITSVKSGH
jgi:hypothetical protein